MRDHWVDRRFQKAGLGLGLGLGLGRYLRGVLVTFDEDGRGPASFGNSESSVYGSLQQPFEVVVFGVQCKACVSPLRDRLAIVHYDSKKRVQDQDSIWGDRGGGQQDRPRGSLEAVGLECGLYHDERVGRVLTVEHVPVERRLVGTVVEHLQERRTTQVEHKLRVDRKHLAQRKACRVLAVGLGLGLGLGSGLGLGNTSLR
jgi:hypothetical protein